MKQASIKSNYMLNSLLAISGFLFPLITFPYVSRILLPTGTGKVAFVTSIVSYFSMFAQLGIPTYGIRACAVVRDDRESLTRTVHELLGITLVMDVVSYALLAAALLTIPRLQEEKLLIVIVSATIFLNSIGMEWLYKAVEQYKYITIRSIAFKIVALIATFLLVKQESDCVIYGGISIFASSASNLLNFCNAKKYVDFRRPKDCDWKRHMKPVMVFFALTCAATVYTNLDSVMLGFMTNVTDVGYYNAAVKVKAVLASVVTALGAVLLPRSSYYIGQGLFDNFKQMGRKSLHFVLLFAAAVMIYFILFAEECILVLSGAEYTQSILPMQIIMPTVLFIGLTNILGIQILVPLGKENIVLKSEIAGAAVDLILNVLLIPSLKSVGAAIGVLAAEAIVLIVQYCELRGEFKHVFQSFSWGRLAAALLIGVLACSWIKLTALGPFPALIISSVCFFGSYVFFLLWRKEALIVEIWGLLLNRFTHEEKE